MLSDDQVPTGLTRHIDLSAQQLTAGELATAAGILGLSGVLGLDSWFAGRTQSQISALAEEAARSLQARGLLERQPTGALQLAPWLALLVTTAATAPRVLVLSASPAKGAERRQLVHLAKGSIVVQTMVGPEQVLLTPVLERKLLNQHLNAFIAPRALRAAPGPSIVLTNDQVLELRRLAPDPQAVHDFLERCGIRFLDTANLQIALTETGERATALLYRRNEPPDLDEPLALMGSAAWVMGPFGGWQMKLRVDGSNTTCFAPTGRKDIRLVIERLIATPFPPDVAG